jgi:hypothetical protein
LVDSEATDAGWAAASEPELDLGATEAEWLLARDAVETELLPFVNTGFCSTKPHAANKIADAIRDPQVVVLRTPPRLEPLLSPLATCMCAFSLV